MQKKTNKGITLIALVITIIVLLILTGVSINMLLGENGLITNTQNAISKYKEEQLKEQAILAVVEAQIQKQNQAPDKTLAQYVQDAGEDGIEVGDGGSIYYEEGEYFYLDKDNNLVELIENEGNLKVGEVIGNNSNVVRKNVSYDANGGTGSLPTSYLKRVGTTV